MSTESTESLSFCPSVARRYVRVSRWAGPRDQRAHEGRLLRRGVLVHPRDLWAPPAAAVRACALSR